VLSIAGLATLLFGIIEGPSKGWSSTEVVLAFAIAAVTLSAFVLWERHTDSPMLDMSLFKNPRFTAASSTITLVFFSLFGSMFLITQYWQLVDGYSPLEAGVRLVPWALTMMIVAPLSARLVEKVGTKRIVLVGLGLIIVGLGLASTIEPHTAYPRAISYFMVMAAGMAMTMAPATESVMGSLPREKAGVGSAVNDTTRQVGGALGVAIIGSAVSSVYASRIGDLAGRFGLTAASTDEAQSSLGSAQKVGSGLGTQASAFIEEANKIFVDAMAIGMRVSIVVVAFAAVMAWRFLPARAATHASTAPVVGDLDAVAEPSPDSVAVAPPATATLSAGD
jgi:EmrB/QacA subfamily drug resistance transporter